MSRRAIWSWTLVLTLALVVWQRRTGPTYPFRGSATVDGTKIGFQLQRSFAGPGGAPVRIAAPGLTGTVNFRFAGSGAPWTALEMTREGDDLIASLPHQPMAGKLEYSVLLRGASQSATLGPVVIRFRSEVPAWVLIPHISCMFFGFLFAARAGLGALNREDDPRFAIAALALIGVGGLILGPIVQKIGLGDFWTGWPLGPDLTDNKTFLAWAIWLPAVFSKRRNWAIAAAVVTFVVFAIPHSVLSGNVVK
jgi:hypothetical protein